MSAGNEPVIAFFPEASFGAALNCVGIAQELRRRGARSVFLTHGGFAGVFADYGFDEFEVETNTTLSEEDAQGYWQEFLGNHLPHFDLSPEDQLETYVAPVWQAIVDTVRELDAGLQRLLDRLSPDVIVLDNVVMFPAIANCGKPWVRVVSCAETEIPDPAVPPYLSGLPSSYRGAFEPFIQRYRKATEAAHRDYNAFRRARGLSHLSDGAFLEPSPYANLLLSPSIVRRDRENVLDANTFVFLEGCVRHESPYRIPHFPRSEGPLVYVSFGSLGSMDQALMQRLIDAFDQIPARFLVNVGALIDSYRDIPDNVQVQEWFPQPSVVQQCDLFLHHGGNNSFCEALYFGVPSLIMPYCWDGHDNATRAQEAGVGARLDRRIWSTGDLRNLIHALTRDEDLSERLKLAAKQMQATPGVVQAAISVLSAAV